MGMKTPSFLHPVPPSVPPQRQRCFHGSGFQIHFICVCASRYILMMFTSLMQSYMALKIEATSQNKNR